MTSVGKQGKCSRCGQEKIIVYNRVDRYSHQETNYCKGFFEFEYSTVNCDLCGLEMVRKNIAKHKLDAHTEKNNLNFTKKSLFELLFYVVYNIITNRLTQHWRSALHVLPIGRKFNFKIWLSLFNCVVPNSYCWDGCSVED